MRRIFIIVIAVISVLALSSAGYTSTRQDMKTRGQPSKGTKPVERFVDQIFDALQKGDVKYMDRLIEENAPMVRDNKVTTIEMCQSFMHQAVMESFNDPEGKSTVYFMVAAVAAQTFEKGTGSRYLLDRVAIFRGWNNEQKKTYRDARQRVGQSMGLAKKTQFAEAAAGFKKSLELYHSIGFKEGAADCMAYLGDTILKMGEPDKAQKQYEEALSIYQEVNSRLGEGNMRLKLADMYRKSRNYEKAQQQYKAVLVIFREINDRFGEAAANLSLGDIHRALEENDHARQYYESVLVIFRELNERAAEARMLRLLGDTHRDLSENKKARMYYEAALTIYRKIKDSKGEAATMQRLNSLPLKN